MDGGRLFKPSPSMQQARANEAVSMNASSLLSGALRLPAKRASSAGPAGRTPVGVGFGALRPSSAAAVGPALGASTASKAGSSGTAARGRMPTALTAALVPAPYIVGTSAAARRVGSFQETLGMSRAASSAGGAARGGDAGAGGSEEGPQIVECPGAPGLFMVVRSAEERNRNPERLNLDRRRLTSCPVLQDERRLRLLNYQNNLISRIEQLSGLPNLIFLDLYNNQIHRMEGLDAVPSLRVLMLGKNRIERIEGLERLTRLDVLDLHSNFIARLENLNHLAELRVLNLAGNGIGEVAGLAGLAALTELNLRRNQIAAVRGLDALPALQRVFLSNNRIASFDAVECLFHMRSLAELALDGNPVAASPAPGRSTPSPPPASPGPEPSPAPDAAAAASSQPLYRFVVLDRIRTLRLLDTAKVSEDERRAVAEGLLAWTEHRQRGDGSARSPSPPALASAPAPAAASSPLPGSARGRPSPAPPVAASPPAAPFEVAAGRLVVSGPGGGALEAALERLSGPVEALELRGVPLPAALTPAALRRLRRLEPLHRLVLACPALASLAQLDGLAGAVGGRVREVELREGPVCGLALLRPYLAAAFPALATLNGAPVAPEERARGAHLFGRLRRLAEASAASDEPAAGLRLEPAPGPPAPGAGPHAAAAAQFVAGAVEHGARVSERIARLSEAWDAIAATIVRQALAEAELLRGARRTPAAPVDVDWAHVPCTELAPFAARDRCTNPR